MRLHKLNLLLSYSVLLLLGILIPNSYQQNAGSIKTTTKNLTFCIRNNTMSNTLETFWHEAQGDCELETKRLVDLYAQFMAQANTQEDQCTALLQHQIRKKIIAVISSQLEEALITHSLQMNRELKQDLKQLQEIDKRVSQVIWERAVNEVYSFLDTKELITEIMSLKEEKVQIVAWQIILNKVFVGNHETETLMPLLTFHLTLMQKKKGSLTKGLERFYLMLPKNLRLLYDSTKQSVGLLNYLHFEYLYAPRDNGPDNNRRLALTWSETKNSTDSDGHLETVFNANGLVSFGSRYTAGLRYLYADVEHQAAYFWIGSGVKSSQWWQVIWPYDSLRRKAVDYMMFQNEETRELLCATTPYDENRRYVTLLSGGENMDNAACYWLVNRF